MMVSSTKKFSRQLAAAPWSARPIYKGWLLLEQAPRAPINRVFSSVSPLLERNRTDRAPIAGL